MGAFSNMDYELQNSEAAVSDAFTEDGAMDSIASTSFRSCKLDFPVMDAEAESVCFLPTADLSGCWLPNISLPPLLVHLMNYRFCDNNLIIILACCQEAPPAVFCTCGALWIIADGTPFH